MQYIEQLINGVLLIHLVQLYVIPLEKDKSVLSVTYFQDIGPKRGSPEYFIQELKKGITEGESSLKTLEALRVSLQSNTIPWLKSFGADGGLELLLNWLQKSQDKEYGDSTHECVKCLKVFMNNKVCESQTFCAKFIEFP